MRLPAFLPAGLLAWLLVGTVSARTVIQVPTDPDSGVHIQIESCFNQLPSGGYAAVDVVVNNSSGRTRTWNLQFGSPGWNAMYLGSDVSEQIHYNASVTVESGATRTFKLLAPLATAEPAATLSVEVSGYGLPNATHDFFPSGTRTGKPTTPALAVSDGASAQLGKHLEEEANLDSRQLYQVSFRADELPDDWRALSGFGGIWLLDNEWGALLPPQRTAVEDWVAAGGSLFICAKAPAAPQERKGLGSIVSMDLRSLDRTATRAQWKENAGADMHSVTRDDSAHWKSAQEIGVLKPNLPLLIGFLAVFGTVVGPLNLFVFAREGRRSRLYWTVPVISLGATGLLLLLIVFMDGFGGWGIRSAVICLVPSARKAVVFQEQISRTGVLGSTAFSLRDPAWMTMVNLDAESRFNRKTPSVQNSDTHYGEDWFKSRSLQSQWIESVIPTRAEVVLINADEARDGGAPPAIVSSIAVPLSDFCFWDSKGKIWRAKEVRTGVKTVLAPGESMKGLPADARDLPADARAALRLRLARAKAVRQGKFMAVSADAASFIETLPSIQWKNRQAIYVGPVTGAEPPK